MSWQELLAVLAPLGMVTIAALKWLVKDWQHKNEQLALVQKEVYTGSLRKIENEHKNLKMELISLKHNIEAHVTNLKAFEKNISEIRTSLKEHQHTLEGYVSNLDMHVKASVKSEVVQLTERIKMLKDKKNG